MSTYRFLIKHDPTAATAGTTLINDVDHEYQALPMAVHLWFYDDPGVKAECEWSGPGADGIEITLSGPTLTQEAADERVAAFIRHKNVEYVGGRSGQPLFVIKRR